MHSCGNTARKGWSWPNFWANWPSFSPGWGGGSRPARPPARGGSKSRRRLPRVRSLCRFRNRGTEYATESCMKWMSGSAKRQCDRALHPPPPARTAPSSRSPARCRRPPACRRRPAGGAAGHCRRPAAAQRTRRWVKPPCRIARVTAGWRSSSCCKFRSASLPTAFAFSRLQVQVSRPRPAGFCSRLPTTTCNRRPNAC